MKRSQNWWSRELILGGCLVLSAVSSGCFQTTVGGQTLPSAYYLDDDVQYFPMGSEQRLSNQIRAVERYRAEQEVSSRRKALDKRIGPPFVCVIVWRGGAVIVA